MRLLPTFLLVAGSAHAQLQFVNIASVAGVDEDTFGRGAAMVDLDGDGLLDLVTANARTDNRFHRQLPDHTFELANGSWGVASDSRSSWGVLVADFDNDGDPGVYFLNGGYSSSEPNQLLRNDIPTNGLLVDVSAISGDASMTTQTFGGTAIDYDQDGLLDIFLSNHGSPCSLLRNEGNLLFTNVSTPAGVIHTGMFKHCGAGDYDNDGWIDLGVADEDVRSPNILYRNNGDGTLSDVASSAGVAYPGPSFGMLFQDYDNDGWLDVYLPLNQQFINKGDPTHSRLFLSQQDGTFLDVTDGSGMTAQTDMGHDSGDLDADGYPDIYIGTGSPFMSSPDVLFLMTPNGSGGLVATDASASSGVLTGGSTRLHGMALGDVDGDGDIDVYASTGGPAWKPETIEKNLLWENQGNASGWIAVDLEGVFSNRGGVGARSKAVTASGREIHRMHSVGRGFANTPSPTQHFGLASETAVERVEVLWPSGIRQIRHHPPAFSRFSMVETGIRLQSRFACCSTGEIGACGPAGDRVELYASLGLLSDPMVLPAVGGILELGPPLMHLASGNLAEDGTLSLALHVPHERTLAGLVVHLQAWIHPPSSVSGGTVSNRIDVTIR